MTTAELIERLRRYDPGGQATVKVFDANSRQFEAVTGLVYGGDEDVIELHSDDIE